MRNKQNVAEFEKELRSTGRAGIESLIKAVRRSGFYKVAGKGGHNCEKGGILNHSLWVLYAARVELKNHPDKYQGVTEDSMILACLLHDLGNTSPWRAFHFYRGHGKRAAQIVDRVKRYHGLDISDIELSAIRFHRGRRIKDDFDRKLDVYGHSPLLHLLKYADRTAKGVFDGVPYGTPMTDSVPGHRETAEYEVVYIPSARYWYLDTRTGLDGLFNTPKGTYHISSLKMKKVVRQFFAVNLFSESSCDLLFMVESDGGIGVMTAVTGCDSRGAVYRTDRNRFHYTSVVMYYNSHGGIYSPACYIAAEEKNGEWTMIKISRGVDCRETVVLNCKTESEAVQAVKNRHGGVDLENGYFLRVEVRP